jgi:hypothetical protein
MSFILRIFFAGLVAFVPSDDGRTVTVLLPQTVPQFFTSDGSAIPPHEPLLLVRAESCSGACGSDDLVIGRILFPQATSDERVHESLASALLGGSAWRLSESEISIESQRSRGAQKTPLWLGSSAARPPKLSSGLPKNQSEALNFDWVADLETLAPGSGVVDPDVFSKQPQKGLVVARWRLTSGNLTSYRLVSFQDRPMPVFFAPLSNQSHQSASRALAAIVMAELEVEGTSLTLVDSGFDGSRHRSVTLTPSNGVIEIALLHAPISHFGTHHQEQEGGSPDPGKHFELFYELSQVRPPIHLRPVPFASSNEGFDLSTGQSQPATGSPLLEALFPPRSLYERVLCPPALLSAGPAEEGRSLRKVKKFRKSSR